jgi:hypothetical protein
MCVKSWDYCGCMCHRNDAVKHIAACCCPHRRRPALCFECYPREEVIDDGSN